MSKSEIKKLLKRFNQIQICSFDAGGGNVLSHFIQGLERKTSFLVSGPSLEIYSKLYPNFQIENKSSIPPDVDLLISSTGWQSDFEFHHMLQALNKGITVIAILDHWVNYKERFTRNGIEILPNYFLAVDELAKNILETEFPGSKVLLTENVFLQKSVFEIKNQRRDINSPLVDFTFIGEPLSRTETNQEWDEFDALKNFFQTLFDLNLQNAKIIIRPHPSENPAKYNSSIPGNFNNVQIDASSSITEILAKSKNVIGCHSMALYLAEMSGIPTYTSLPEGMKSKLPILKSASIKSFCITNL